MSISSHLYSLAMELPVDQREELANRLLDSLHGDEAAPPTLDAEFEAELERRVESIENGTASGIDRDASIARLRALLSQRST